MGGGDPRMHLLVDPDLRVDETFGDPITERLAHQVEPAPDTAFRQPPFGDFFDRVSSTGFLCQVC